jgi:kynurenine formamidase
VTFLDELIDRLTDGRLEVIDLTTPLSERTTTIALPPDHGQPWPFTREIISQYDERGHDVYWNNIRLSEHTGTHFDAPIHWSSGADLDDVSEVPPSRLVAPAAVLDVTSEVADDNDFLLQRRHVEKWEIEHGPLPRGGWLLVRTGWDARSGDSDAFLNDGHTPGISSDCARWLAEETDLIGVGVETVGTDAGAAATFEPAFPCHWFFQGSNKYGLTQLRNLSLLPPLGTVIVAGPLPIVRGSGSPARVLGLVEAGGSH